MSISKTELLLESQNMMEQIYNRLEELKSINLNSLPNNNTMIVIVDMNNGFAKGGALYSQRVEGLINPIKELAQEAINKKIRVIAFTDYHTDESPELKSYPRHCMMDTNEWEIVDELNIEGIKVIKKNSTNGFIEPDFEIPENIKNIIVVGDCTDICIYQFAVTVKTHFNRLNKEGYVYIPMNLVETFDAPFHKANFMNYVFLNSMIDNGVDVVKEIIFN